MGMGDGGGIKQLEKQRINFKGRCMKIKQN